MMMHSSVNPMSKQPRPVVLVAEDHPVNRKVMGLLLTMLGVENDMVTNGRDAVEAVQADRYALVLMDIMMPQMDGFQAAFAIRSKEFGQARHVPIIACTAISRKIIEEQCIRSGIDDYMSKPISRETLQSKIKQWSFIPMSTDTATAEMELQVNRLKRTAAEQDAQESLDQNMLNLMYGLGQVDDIMELFLTVTVALLAQLESAILHQDLVTVRLMANEIKGSSYAVTANEMARLCRDLERQGEEQDWPEVARIYTALGLAFARVRQFLEKRQEDITGRKAS